jgi:hypothetical protein
MGYSRSRAYYTTKISNDDYVHGYERRRNRIGCKGKGRRRSTKGKQDPSPSSDPHVLYCPQSLQLLDMCLQNRLYDLWEQHKKLSKPQPLI